MSADNNELAELIEQHRRARLALRLDPNHPVTELLLEAFGDACQDRDPPEELFRDQTITGEGHGLIVRNAFLAFLKTRLNMDIPDSLSTLGALFDYLTSQRTIEGWRRYLPQQAQLSQS